MIEPEAALRFLQYGCLLPLAGILIDPVRRGRSDHGAGSGLTWLALSGLGVSIAGFGSTMQAMTGEPLSSIDGELARFVLIETGSGIAFLVRSTALVVTTMLLAAGRRRAATPLAMLAVASLAWSGHAATSDGAAGIVHRLVDVLHLAAVAGWLGAIAVLLRMNFPSASDRASIGDRVASLRRFSATGSLLVATVVLSGACNLVAVVGVDDMAMLPSSQYGRLLGLKLLAFLAMLIPAAVNRWRLTQMLARDERRAAAALRLSLSMELALGMTILAVVAVLGTLDPVAPA
ncbi:copper homeostasis membrane protein CopD [Sphingomonas hankookensis]|uniref:Copper resistance protein CopD n=1 Tax=Sphingomonas hengshuiensis TaxID=1609977 RepID=A0A2W5B075_9SPHN|nr:MAG: copper resistance protein CopD [Sphingomonas hengshuiensis]